MIDRINEQPFCQTRVSGSTFVNADCFDVFPFIEDKSIDAIICDLPYGYLNRSNVITWDNEIDLDLLWKQYERVIKATGVIILTASQPFASRLILSNEKLFKQELIWLKKDSADFVNAKNRHLKAHENILVFSKGNIANGCKNKITYNPQGLQPKNKTRNVCKKNNTFMGKREQQDGKEYVQEFTNYPMSYFFFNRNDDGKKNEHPTQKPISLMEYLILTYTNEGDTVLDNTMGSGTTNLACIKLNRKSIGIEKEKQYYDVAVRRALKYLGNDTYKNIQEKVNYDKLLSSGMFWEVHPELSGNWDVDREVVQYCH